MAETTQNYHLAAGRPIYNCCTYEVVRGLKSAAISRSPGNRYNLFIVQHNSERGRVCNNTKIELAYYRDNVIVY